MAAAAEHRPEGWLERTYGELTPGGLPLNATTPQLATSQVVKAGAGSLYAVTVFNNNVAARFVLAFDGSSVPANATVPEIIIPVGAGAVAQLSWPYLGRAFKRGIVFAISTTAASLTLAAADLWLDAQYL